MILTNSVPDVTSSMGPCGIHFDSVHSRVFCSGVTPELGHYKKLTFLSEYDSSSVDLPCRCWNYPLLSWQHGLQSLCLVVFCKTYTPEFGLDIGFLGKGSLLSMDPVLMYPSASRLVVTSSFMRE